MAADCQYRLRCSLRGHSMDVRAVAVTLLPEGFVVSGSRDKSAKVWKPSDDDLSFYEACTLKGHTHFISCVSVTPPTETYPTGLILTGSNDNKIRAFTLGSDGPVFELTGHQNTVSALSGGKFGLVISGSWDQTVKVWCEQKCAATLLGHSAAVWAVSFLPERERFLSGSADKTIKLWQGSNCKMTFTGHTDCVRGLAVLTANDFLSCSNDATVRHWLVDGECVGVYEGHTNFIYSIAILPNGQDFVTGGEDRTMRVWKNGVCSQTIFLPAQSVWCVSCLPNGDLIAGSSDGVVRIFSCSTNRQGGPEEIKAFEDEVSNCTVAAEQELGGMKISSLPGLEALLQPGRRDGQTKMVREGGLVTCYSWSDATGEWTQVGQVVGASGATQNSSGKQLFEGQEYDYVFNIELEEGKTGLKLPYNISEDPWFAAQRFIHKHDLSQLFLDQIANFIVANTKGMSLGQQAPSGFSDPFTGGNRYVPGVTGGAANGISGQDPFTGGNRYTPAERTSPDGMDSSSSKTTDTTQPPSFFPQMTFLRFDQANLDAILGKLCEFNSKTGDGQHKIADDVLTEVLKLADTNHAPDSLHLQLLQKLLQWPNDIIFPVLDILRLAVREEGTCQFFCADDRKTNEFGQFLVQHFSASDSAANQTLALRTLANLFPSQAARKLLLRFHEAILSSLLHLAPYKSKNVQVAAATVLLNFSVLDIQDPSWKAQCISVACSVLEHMSDGEACFRTLVGLGTLLVMEGGGEPKIALELAASLNLQPRLQQLRLNSDLLKVKQCCAQLLALFR